MPFSAAPVVAASADMEAMGALPRHLGKPQAAAVDRAPTAREAK